MVPTGKTSAHDSSANGDVVCKMCNKRAETACEVCGDGYCSTNCQKQDWIYNNHRSVCRPMPKLISLHEFKKHMETESLNFAAPASSNIRETNAQRSNNIAPQQNESNNCQRENQNHQQPHNNNFKGNQHRQHKNEVKSPHQRQHYEVRGGQQQYNNHVRGNQPQAHNNEAKSPQQQHHYNPFKSTPQTIPHNNEIKSPQQEQQQKDLKNGDVIVFITGFRNSHSCVVCYLRDTHTYYDLAKQINELSASAPVFKGIPAIGDLVVIRDNDMMQRGRIINAFPDAKYACVLYDSGNVVNRRANELYEMPTEVAQMHHITFLVKLKGVQDHKMCDAARKFLNRFINKSYLANINANLAVLTETTNKSVSLNEQIEEYFSSNGPQSHKDSSSSTELNAGPAKNENNFRSGPQQNQQRNRRSNQNHTNSGRSSRSPQSIENSNKMNYKAPEPEQNPTPNQNQIQNPTPTISAPRTRTNAVMNPPFKFQKLQERCGEFIGCITDNSNLKFGYIGCVPCGKLPSLLQVMQYTDTYKDTEGQAYVPQLGEYCLSIFPEDGTFYRAKIIEISDSSKYRVRFIDFTNECWVTSDVIRRYPDDLKVDCFTTLCTIQGLPEYLNKKQLEFLEQKLDFQSKINIKDVVGYKDEVAVLDCGEVLTWLDHEGLLD